MKHGIKRQVVKAGLLAVALWLVAMQPTLAQDSIIAPVGDQFFSWIDTFNTDFYPVLVSAGILVAVFLGAVVSIKLGIFAFVGVVAAAIAWGLRIGVIALGA